MWGVTLVDFLPLVCLPTCYAHESEVLPLHASTTCKRTVLLAIRQVVLLITVGRAGLGYV